MTVVRPHLQYVMASGKSVYLDYNATTPLAPEVLDVITETLRDAWANPSSSNHLGEDRGDLIWVSKLASQPATLGSGQVCR